MNIGNTRKHASATNQYFRIVYGVLENIVGAAVRKQGNNQDGIIFNKIYPLHITVFCFIIF